jgi:hypothetical protein
LLLLLMRIKNHTKMTHSTQLNSTQHVNWEDST